AAGPPLARRVRRAGRLFFCHRCGLLRPRPATQTASPMLQKSDMAHEDCGFSVLRGADPVLFSGHFLSRSCPGERTIMIRQRTLRNTIRATGVGLHSGDKVYMTLRPAAVDT